MRSWFSVVYRDAEQIHRVKGKQSGIYSLVRKLEKQGPGQLLLVTSGALMGSCTLWEYLALISREHLANVSVWLCSIPIYLVSSSLAKRNTV